jgi:hypothetical protein
MLHQAEICPGGYERKNIAPPKNMLRDMLSDFSKNFAVKYNKSIMLSFVLSLILLAQ